MKEKELYTYLQIVERCEHISMQIKVLETKINSPQTVAYGMPKGTIKPPGEWLTVIIDERDRLLKIYQKILSEQTERYLLMLDIEFKLERKIESDLFSLLYIKGKSIYEASRTLNYSASSLYKIRKRIIAQLESMSIERDANGNMYIKNKA